MKIDVLTLFPEFFTNINNWSIIGRAIEKKIMDISYTNIRDFSNNKHRKVDDYPYGGGGGMIMTPQPIYDAIKSVETEESKIIYLSPQGRKLNQNIINDLSKENHLVFLCGHYEGVDNRIIENYIDEEISIGDYVLTGGEIPAMVIIDAVTRLLPGVLSNEDAYREDSHYYGLLEHPQYTRPRDFNGLKVPAILLSGNHNLIEEWKDQESLKTTLKKRPDLLENIKLKKTHQDWISRFKGETNS